MEKIESGEVCCGARGADRGNTGRGKRVAFGINSDKEGVTFSYFSY
jgi:hypothetical protein